MQKQTNSFLFNENYTLIERKDYDEITYKELYVNNSFYVEIYRERGITSFSLSNSGKEGSWIEVNLVKALLIKDTNLLDVMNESETGAFIIENENSVSSLFSEKNYLSTLDQILEIKKNRRRILFPNLNY